MTPAPAPQARRITQGVIDGIGALRLLVVVALALDAAQGFQVLVVGPANWSVAGAMTTTQLVLTVAAAAATMWLRPWLALALGALVLVLALVNRPTSEEFWLMLVVAVTVGARARVPVILLVVVVQLGYAMLFGLRVERRYPGAGAQAAFAVVAFCAVGYTAGLVVRRLMRVLEGRRHRSAELERENAEIRAAERRRLADDLQTVVTGGLATIRRQLDQLRSEAGDGMAIRRGLDRIDQESRSVLTELRALLEILRRDFSSETSERIIPPTRGRRFLAVLTARHIRLASSAVFALLAVRAALGRGDAPLEAALVVHMGGWIAAAVAVWAPRAGGLLAAGVLVVSLGAGTPTGWVALPVVLLFFVSALHTSVRRLWMVALGFVTYGALLAVTAPDWGDRLLIASYAGALGVIGGLAARHFIGVEQASTRLHAALLDDRKILEAQERTAIARELHDVVAHQLSLTTMIIMGTSASTDPQELVSTLTKVEEAVEAAGHELFALLHAMRGTQADEVESTPLVLPSSAADTFARRLTASGFRPEVVADRVADDLDATTHRTLGRIMQEATTNIVRYAPAGSTCQYALSVTDDSVQLVVASPLPVREGKSALSLGWGLRGIAERVELSHGSFTAGPERGMWLVDVTLPRSGDRTAVPTSALIR